MLCTKLILRATVLLQKVIVFQMFHIRLTLAICSLMKNIEDNAEIEKIYMREI